MKSNNNSLLEPYWVLIVDNDGMLADAYEKIIERAGGRPLSVGNGKEAIAVLQNKRVDAVLLELQLPRMNGMQLLEWMEEHVPASPARVVLSNDDDPQDIMKAYELGADRYVLKAWASPSDLVNVLNQTLAHNIRNPLGLQAQC